MKATSAPNRSFWIAVKRSRVTKSIRGLQTTIPAWSAGIALLAEQLLGDDGTVDREQRLGLGRDVRVFAVEAARVGADQLGTVWVDAIGIDAVGIDAVGINAVRIDAIELEPVCADAVLAAGPAGTAGMGRGDRGKSSDSNDGSEEELADHDTLLEELRVGTVPSVDGRKVVAASFRQTASAGRLVS